MEINVISQILGYCSKTGLALFRILFRFSMILVKDYLCYTTTSVQPAYSLKLHKYMCKQCLTGASSMQAWEGNSLF